ncbi:hypothetical protein SMGD1_1600 [Sulfurimonas gotlandica GD1]|uniref:Alginate export domain-containing protein n=1 Tax=Sulfurimonas gotlandica (strain DSM 19862 / JCM 16533 / GD1) TaxID=929558 RepID=B6BHX2_SULGG|nr:hypothetical protein [Sulfurimonas gotlandica]EDZ63796.1 conserved hypothetical protein [Sulfurimonas gotlandica GD1]EHP30124.1 hypothetical protein SMGD1_1600 [Sulfurimonas gotlandica GD1]
MRKIVLLLVLLTPALFAEFEYRVDNTNFTISQGSIEPNTDKTYVYNYDRLRFRGDYTEGNYFVTLIGDGVNYFGHDYVSSNDFNYVKEIKSDTPFSTQTNHHDYYEGSVYAKLYRLYGGYEDNKNRAVVGLQNISMGVGRIWTPTNLFNPKNIYSLEPDETFGVAALSYTRHINDTSHLSAVASQNADYTFKYGARYKAFLDFADFAIDAVSSDDTKMLGVELEGNLGDTGVEVRSEGAYIKNTLKTLSGLDEKEFFQGIIGADYGFVNGLTVIGEALYSSEKFTRGEILLNRDSEILSNLVSSNFYTAISATYTFNIFLDGGLVYIESFNDKNSRFISPTLTYTMNDYNTFVLGAMIQNGPSGSDFGDYENTYYFKYALSF